MNSDQLISSYRAAGQGQVFAFWDSLAGPARQELLAQAAPRKPLRALISGGSKPSEPGVA